MWKILNRLLEFAAGQRQRQRVNLMERTHAGGAEHVYETSISTVLHVL